MCSVLIRVSPQRFDAGRNPRTPRPGRLRPLRPPSPVLMLTIHTVLWGPTGPSSVRSIISMPSVSRLAGRARPTWDHRSMFIDRARIVAHAGHGGAGRAHIHSEPFKPRGGPDGGDGGRGGDVVV